MKDALLKVTKYLPAAAANNTTDSIDLEGVRTADRKERAPFIVARVNVPALANNTDSTKTILLDLVESEDNITFTEVAPLIECKVPGVASTGSVETEFVYPLPKTKQYIALKQTVPSGAGDNTLGLVTFELVF